MATKKDWYYMILGGGFAIALILMFSLVFSTCSTQAQPVPKQEQNTRLILALEQHNKALEENTRAMRELTQALRQSKSPF